MYLVPLDDGAVDAAERFPDPSPYSINAFLMLTPVGGVTWIVNVTVVGFDGVVGTDGVMLIVGIATGMTVTEVDWADHIAESVRHSDDDLICSRDRKDVRDDRVTRDDAEVLRCSRRPSPP